MKLDFIMVTGDFEKIEFLKFFIDYINSLMIYLSVEQLNNIDKYEVLKEKHSELELANYFYNKHKNDIISIFNFFIIDSFDKET